MVPEALATSGASIALKNALDLGFADRIGSCDIFATTQAESVACLPDSECFFKGRAGFKCWFKPTVADKSLGNHRRHTNR